jgi:hypothetical protein
MFIAALFTIVKLWNQSWCQTTNEDWNYVVCMKMDRTLDHPDKLISQAQKAKYCKFILLCGIYRQTNDGGDNEDNKNESNETGA